MKATYMFFALAAVYVAAVTSGCDDDETTAAGPGPGSTSSAGGSGGSGGAGAGGSGGGGGDAFVFQDFPDTAYARIDRHGAVEAGTVGIKIVAGLCQAGLSPYTLDSNNMPVAGPAVDCAIRDQYNEDDPTDDAAGTWVSLANDGISASVSTLQSVLADDLAGLSLTAADLQTGLAQAGPVIVPDTIKYNPAAPIGYPNGRALTDPAVDLTIAAAILDLNAHSLDTLANVPLNPPANDVPFKTSFPYLADPH